jgi:hypothetical protein
MRMIIEILILIHFSKIKNPWKKLNLIQLEKKSYLKTQVATKLMSIKCDYYQFKNLLVR